MNVLITGNEGFVGRHLEKRLVQDGHEVVGIDIKSGKEASNFFRSSFHKFDLAFHCAAFVGGREAIDNSPLRIATNAALDAWFFKWLETSKTTHGVYFSSSAAYPTIYQGAISSRKLREDDIHPDFPEAGDSTYGEVKLFGERLARVAKERGIGVTVLRPFSGYGEDQDLDYPFPSFIQRAAERQDPFQIWGDGKQVRDWIHIDDIVEATLLAVENCIDYPVNLGTGRPLDFTSLAQLVCQQAGYTPTLEYLTDAPRGVSYRCSDNSKLLEFYTPKISIEEGIARALHRLDK